MVPGDLFCGGARTLDFRPRSVASNWQPKDLGQDTIRLTPRLA